MSLPKVSIVIPSYKAAHFEACLRSAIGQTYLNTEILVSDNCPTEDIKHICGRFPGVLYQRCTVIREDNVLAALFSGKGQYIKPLFDDDLLHPFCIERMVAAMEMSAQHQLIFSASQVIDSDNQRTDTRRPYQANGSLDGRDLQRSMTLGMRNFVGEFSTIMFRRDKLWAIGYKDLFRIGRHDFTRGLADVAAYINLARDGQAFYLDEELSYFRHDPRLDSNSNINANPHFGNCFSDYIDLIVVGHEVGAITTEELLALDAQVASVSTRLQAVFVQMAPAHQRYRDYAAMLKQA